VERYFQLARCYRDEDLRADRQPEFTQVDIEMSFIDREDIYALIEGLLKRVWKTALDMDIPTPFKRISFEEALNRYGIDKPDTRFGMELVDFTEDFRASTFKVFSGAIANGGVVKAINAKGLAGATQGQIETMTEYAKSFGAKGLAYIKVENGEWKSPIVKFFSDAEKQALTRQAGIEEGDLILFAADQWLNACEILGKIRLYCADVLKSQGKLTIDPTRFDFLWVVEFPLLEFRQGDEPLVFQPSSVHRARRGGHPVAQDRPQEGPRPALRHRGERRGTRRRLDPYPSARRAEDHLRGDAPDSAG
jgi:aspartyl-tRNA synthetase